MYLQRGSRRSPSSTQFLGRKSCCWVLGGKDSLVEGSFALDEHGPTVPMASGPLQLPMAEHSNSSHNVDAG